MKFLTNKGIIQKIVIALIIVIVFNFCVPVRVEAGWDIGTDILKEIVLLVVYLGDIVMGAFNNFMLGVKSGTRRFRFCSY